MARITRKQFRKHKDQALSVNIRLRKRGGSKPTKDEVLDALQEIIDTGKVPKGWQFGAIDWHRPGWATKDWREGKLSDIMGNLNAPLQVMIEDARVGLVRNTEWEIEIGMKY